MAFTFQVLKALFLSTTFEENIFYGFVWEDKGGVIEIIDRILNTQILTIL